MNTQKEILGNKIQATKQLLNKLESAYKVLEELDEGTTVISEPESFKPSLGETGAISLDDLELPKKEVKTGDSLYAQIKALVDRFGAQEFTVNHVELALRKMGKGTDAKHFKNRVSVLVRKLMDEGILERTHKGVGSDPHLYKNKIRTIKSNYGISRSEK